VIHTYPIGWTVAGHGKLKKPRLAQDFDNYAEFSDLPLEARKEHLSTEEDMILGRYAPVKHDIFNMGDILEVTLVARNDDEVEC